ncbi:MAG: dicarboxylate/amino acid:cation symporter [Pseudomonadota bacterium]
MKFSGSQSARGKSLNKSIQSLIAQHLWLKILIGLFLGIAVGLLLSPSGGALLPTETAYEVGGWIALPGIIFLGLIKMVIVPLVVCSIILGITTSGDLGFLKNIGFRLVGYFIATTAISISIGILLVNLIQPGQFVDTQFVDDAVGASAGIVPTQTFDELTIPQRIANMIPTNFTQASLERNMLQIVIAGILIGIVILTLPKDTTKPFHDLCVFGQVATMKIISWAMAIAPYAVFGLICEVIIRIGFDALVGVGAYFVTVILGLICMLGVYMAIIVIIGGRNPLTFFSKIREVQLLAFSTSSSAAVMPLSIQAAEEKLDVSEDVARFTIPVGATINMDGTAMYQAIAALFLCQIFGVELTATETLLLLVTTIGASIGTPGTPGVGIVVLATILVGIGVPEYGIAIILGVDRILDMCRTTINVTGDLTASVVMQRWLK